jgi:transposase, IS5 family
MPRKWNASARGAHAPYEFGVKVSIATTLKRLKGSQFALHAKALPDNPYDGDTLAEVIPDMEKIIGNGVKCLLADAGYRGHNAPLSHRFKVYTSGQKRRITSAIKREMKRRTAIEPVIGHIKNEHRMGRNYLAGTRGDAINAVLGAAATTLASPHLLRLLLRLILEGLVAQTRALDTAAARNPDCSRSTYSRRCPLSREATATFGLRHW